jgi:hypothetical protein
MPIYAERNLYPGVNAHLNNYLQTVNRARWRGFHSAYITLLRMAIDQALPSGYVASEEESIQIDEINGLGGSDSSMTIADVQIFTATRNRSPIMADVLAVATPTVTLPLTTTLDPEDSLSGIVILRLDETRLTTKPVALIELISPSNKRGGSHHALYLAKRSLMLRSDVCVVEVDFLQLSPSLLPDMTPLEVKAGKSLPYMILVNNPQPFYEEGTLDVYGFGVLDAIPRIRVPLAGKDSVIIDFAAIYQDVFEKTPLFQMTADYATDPPAFDRFTPADQSALSAFLADIRAQHTSA